MIGILKIFQTYEQTIYFILGLGGLVYFWRFYQAWQEARGAVFGLEAETARAGVNRAAVSLFILLLIAFIVFILVTFIAPVMAPDIPQVLPLQPVEITATYLADPEAAETLEAIANISASPTPLPTVDVSLEGCVEGEIDITSPEDGETIRGVVEVSGSAQVVNFDFYKLEIANPSNSLWLTIEAGNNQILENVLVPNWDTSLYSPGEYILQLVVYSDNEAQTPCRIPIFIANDQ
ncbi:MAG: hypothetical protein HON98_00200 [Chloroflexi bacterium]|jgi:hypothetical protein|nr:hypothetical protein [Chloroflexota bacterium]MBT4003931.1 hypothetical protein [Chloroflexota bacterium]MBT4305763.1 hypothetical protein [Chloroflexota bacterium]MBT4533587.1 hypothetical protein [Chloroflexota bacterium]MBT4681770.1 hypothetical protein [Chloroflexota bacterium]